MKQYFADREISSEKLLEKVFVYKMSHKSTNFVCKAKKTNGNLEKHSEWNSTNIDPATVWKPVGEPLREPVPYRFSVAHKTVLVTLNISLTNGFVYPRSHRTCVEPTGELKDHCCFQNQV